MKTHMNSGVTEKGCGDAAGCATLRAFTLIELLTVITIIGILAAVVAPSLSNWRKSDSTAAASRMLLDGVARARQLAISERTTVYMVFVPTNFWAPPNYFPRATMSPAELNAATNLVERQLRGFTFVSLRSIGDQPGQDTPRYLSEWQTLPDSVFIAFDKFYFPDYDYWANLYLLSGFKVYGFNTTTNIPFPLENSAFDPPASRPVVRLPYIAFNYLGQLATEDGRPLGRDIFIPLSQGSVTVARDQNQVPIMSATAPFSPPNVQEKPPGNTTNSYNLIHIDWLTGRARVEHPEMQ